MAIENKNTDPKSNSSGSSTSSTPQQEIKPREVFKALSDFFLNLIDLNPGLDREGTIVNIKNNKKMEGANAWLLMCSIVIASLGLDLNSPAVIIGAMLISPLMSPILGIGLAIGINDKDAFVVALKHFGVAIGIALVTSTIYFWLTPFGNETAEIRARTAPTLLDVMVAFFGGIAGIISGSRKDKSNAIPGVAIATALMPPLCVTGYGIATQNTAFMLNSFYLFFLNATFVSLATFLIVRFLKFPLKNFVSEKEERKTRWKLGLFVILMIIPSGKILLNVLQKARQQNIISTFLEKNFNDAIYNIEPVLGSDSIDIKLFTGKYYEKHEIDSFNLLLQNQGAKFFDLNFLQDDEARIALQQLEITKEKHNIAKNESVTLSRRQSNLIESLTSKLDSLQNQNLIFQELSEEVSVLFPEIEEINFSKSTSILKTGEKNPSDHSLFLYSFSKVGKRMSNTQKKSLEDKLKNFIVLRLNAPDIIVKQVES